MGEGFETLLLSASDVADCIGISDVIPIVEEVFRADGEGRVSMPPKLAVDMRRLDNPNWFHAMPAYVPGSGAAGIKWAGGADGNRKHGLPYIVSTLTINDPQTALPLAVMDATVITALRTGAAAAVAAKYLARRDRPNRIAIIGAGMQGRACATALTTMLDIAEMRVADMDVEAARELAARVTGTAWDSPEDAVRGSDLVVTATTAGSPLFSALTGGDAALVIAIGSNPELDPQLIVNADKVLVDNREQNRTRGQLSDVLKAGLLRFESIYAELGEVIAGRLPGRESPTERIVVCMLGMASEDIALGAAVYDIALRRGIGSRFNFLA
jgi:alanine dehydrogenase